MAAVIFDGAGLARLLESEEGPVGRRLAQSAIRVTTQAQLNATGIPVEGAVNPEGRGPRVQTGRLRSSITWRLGRDSRGLFARVGTNVFYGRILELGLTANGARYPFLLPALSAI